VKNENRAPHNTFVIAFRSGRFDGRFSLTSSSPPFLPPFYIHKDKELGNLEHSPNEQELQQQ
jgi:hypothetical protein